MRMRLIAAVISLFVATGDARAATASAILDDNGTVVTSLDPALLRNPEVLRHLRSGLTTNFYLRVAGGKPAARVEVRFEPWDEVYYIRVIGADGRIDKRSVNSAAAFEEWWSSPMVAIMKGAAIGRLSLTVEVVPFSASEEADAKKWLARSADRAAAPAGGPAPQPAIASAPSLFGAVIGSSVRRRPVLSHSWTVDVKRRAP